MIIKSNNLQGEKINISRNKTIFLLHNLVFQNPDVSRNDIGLG